MLVYIVDNVGYVWDLADVIDLRRKHRIVGSLVGSKAHRDDVKCLPLLLMPEEMQLLKEKGIVRLVRTPSLEKEPDQRVQQLFQEHRENSYQEQVEIYKEERKKEINRMADKIVEGKKRKLLGNLKNKRKRPSEGIGGDVKRKKGEVDESAISESGVGEEENDSEELVKVDREAVIAQEIAKIKPINREQALVQVFVKHPWLGSKDLVNSLWSYPLKDPLKRCRLFTFKDLWNNNYYLTEGTKFGGDFLVYMGDPVRFHAKYVVLCQLEEPKEGFRPQDLIARSRLGSGVKKTILFAWLEGTEVKYRTVEWDRVDKGGQEEPADASFNNAADS